MGFPNQCFLSPCPPPSLGVLFAEIIVERNRRYSTCKTKSLTVSLVYIIKQDHSTSPIVTCLARGDFAGPGYGNCQAKSRAYSDNVEARQALAYDVLHSLESIWVGLKLTTSKRKSTRLYQWPTNWLPFKNSLPILTQRLGPNLLWSRPEGSCSEQASNPANA